MLYAVKRYKRVKYVKIIHFKHKQNEESIIVHHIVIIGIEMIKFCGMIDEMSLIDPFNEENKIRSKI